MARQKLDFDVPLLDLDDKPLRTGLPQEAAAALNVAFEFIPEGDKKACGEKLDELLGAPLTLKRACVQSLLGAYESEKNLGEDERMRRYELARRLNKGGMQEFNDKERDLLKKMAGMRYLGSLVSPLICELLESASKITEVKAVHPA